MKLVNYCILFLGFWLGVSSTTAQAQCASTPNDPTAFTAVDNITGVELGAFCVGRGVRFVQRPGRNVPNNTLSYGVRPGMNIDYFPTCLPPTTNRPPTYVYTPTAAEVGTVTVSELASGVGTGVPSTYYIRNYRVYDTPMPTFTVAPCPAGSVQVTLTDATAYDSYTVQAGAGPSQPITRAAPVTVSVPAGATTVTVTGHYAAPGLNGLCEGSRSLNIDVLPAAPAPSFASLTLQAPLPGGAATLALGNLPTGYLSTLQIADGSAPGGFRTLAPIPAGSTSFPLPSAATGCYRVFRTDACGISAIASNIICTLSLTGSSSQNRNQLLLTDAGSGNTYAVTRNDQAYTAVTAIAGGLEDADVQCGTTYTYRITATQPGGGMAVSNTVSVTTQSALPPSRPRLLATFNRNDVVELTPLPAVPLTTGSSLRYRRSVGGQAPADFGAPATTVRVQRDSTALGTLLAQPPCYTVSLTDLCGNTSPESSPACPALLSVRAADPDGATATLTWTSFTGPNQNIAQSYTLQRLAADGTVLSTVAVSGNSYTDLTPPTDRQVLRYRLQISGGGLAAGTFSYSNRATLSRQLALAMPTAFTPNGDGLNDVLEVKGKYLNNYVFVVVDRNGQEVFRGTQRSETWDGTIKGHAPVLGAYVWRFEQANEDGGQPFIKTGAITLLK